MDISDEQISGARPRYRDDDYEIAEMEYHLAHLLGRLLGSTAEVAEALYFTLKGGTPRIQLLENVAPLVLAGNKEKLSRVLKATERATALMGKRHNLVHNRFTVEDSEITTVRYEHGRPISEPVLLPKLTNLVREIRRLNGKLIDLIAHGSADAWLES